MRHFDVERSSEALAGEIPEYPVDAFHKQHKCLICQLTLEPGERKVHVGRCARERKTQLQRLQRRRERLHGRG